MLADELIIVDAESALWKVARPLLEAALRLEQNNDTYTWHGWRKHSINTFLKHLPQHCTLLVGVWEEGGEPESLMLGCVCEVIEGTVCSIRTFETLADANLPPTKDLEPGYQHALELMRVAKKLIAPVAWALFTDKKTWDEWVFAQDENSNGIGKGELLALLAQQGRCVLMGNQTKDHY